MRYSPTILLLFVTAFVLLNTFVAAQDDFDIGATAESVMENMETEKLPIENVADTQEREVVFDGTAVQDTAEATPPPREVVPDCPPPVDCSNYEVELNAALQQIADGKAKNLQLSQAVIHIEQRSKAAESSLRTSREEAIQKETELIEKIIGLEASLGQARKDVDSLSTALKAAGDSAGFGSEYKQKIEEFGAVLVSAKAAAEEKFWQEAFPHVRFVVAYQYNLLGDGAKWLYYDLMLGQFIPFITDKAIPSAKEVYSSKVAAPVSAFYGSHVTPWWSENVYPHYQQHMEQHVNTAHATSLQIHSQYIQPLLDSFWKLYAAHVTPLLEQYLYRPYEIVKAEVLFVRHFTVRLFTDEALQTEVQSITFDGLQTALGVFPFLVTAYSQFLKTFAVILATVAVGMSTLTVVLWLPLPKILVIVLKLTALACFPTATVVLVFALLSYAIISYAAAALKGSKGKKKSLK